METTYDPTKQDVGNLIFLEHLNLCIPDPLLATAFYVEGLGLTRDPYMRVEHDQVGINIGRSQIHLPPSGLKRRGRVTPTMRVPGVVGLVLPDLGELAQRFEIARRALKDTQFSYEVCAGYVEATCPWGNRFRCHAPSPEFGDTELAMAYVEFDAPRGTVASIARFYREVMRAVVKLEERGGSPVANVRVGGGQKLLFRETDVVPEYDGYHLQIYISDFSGPLRILNERGLVVQESETFYRFNDIVDLTSGKVLYTFEHEIRSLSHPAYNRQLINRNPNLSSNNGKPSHEAFCGHY